MRFILSLLILASILSGQAAYGGAAVIFSGSDVKALKSNLDLNGQAKVKTGSTDPSSAGSVAPIGSIYLRTGTGQVWVKTGAASTAWTRLAASGAAVSRTVSTRTADYTVLTTDDVILINAGAAASDLTMTLPTAVGNDGLALTFKRINEDGQDVIIAAFGAQTIDGDSTQTLTVGFQAITLISDGSNWHVF